MRILVADLVTELEPRYDDSRELAEPFRYEGSRETDIKLHVSDKLLNNLMEKAAAGTTVGEMENFALGNDFNRKVIAFNTMLIHSSALVYDGGAYLFSADSGVGKSTHTRLWLQAFGDTVHILNDDKPVVKLCDDKAVCYGTPFDGGSGIALNESYPLQAVIFIDRGETNSVRVPDNKEVIQRLYFQTAHMVNAATAVQMLDNIEKLLSLTRFYVLTCNMELSAAYTAFDAVIGGRLPE